jgi:CRISPR-associated endonuclease/helicase Cas3
MTSIIEPMPGRPEVGPWLRGVDDELPQTTIAWRAELDLSGFDQLDLEDIEEWFDTHRVLAHETLSVPTHVAAKRFSERWAKLTETQKSDVGSRPIVVDRAGLKVISVKDLIAQLERTSADKTAAISNADLILPASFGGIERGKGTLNADAPVVPKDEAKMPLDEQLKARAVRRSAPDVADARGRCRQLITKSEDGEPVIVAIGSGAKPPNPSVFVLDLESDDDKRVQLISYVPKREKLELGNTKQTLSEHVGLVGKHLDDILNRLELPDSIKRAARLAADFHDHGKNRERWQRTVKGTETPAGQPWSDATLGKSGGEMNRDRRGYRHEFGSLREFLDAHQGKIEPEVFDLAAHLIAAHHGRGRPHFPKGGFDPHCESRSDEIHTEAIRRFARLQRKYGWWHLAWLENLLRCADALASSEQDATGGEN